MQFVLNQPNRPVFTTRSMLGNTRFLLPGGAGCQQGPEAEAEPAGYPRHRKVLGTQPAGWGQAAVRWSGRVFATRGAGSRSRRAPAERGCPEAPGDAGEPRSARGSAGCRHGGAIWRRCGGTTLQGRGRRPSCPSCPRCPLALPVLPAGAARRRLPCRPTRRPRSHCSASLGAHRAATQP